MPHVILDLCKRDKTNQLMKQLNDDVDEFAQRGLRSLAVAIEDLPNGQIEGEGNGFKLIGLVPFHDSLCLDATETIDLAGKLGKTNSFLFI
jgi:H+-transporting ATPase